MEFPFLKDRTVSISQSSIVFAVALILGLFVVFQIRFILELLFMAFILMVALNPVVKRFMRWGMRRTIAIALSFVLLFLTISIFLAIIVPPLVYQLINLFDYLSTIPWLTAQLALFDSDLTFAQKALSGFEFSVTDVRTAIGDLTTPFRVAFSIITSLFSNLLLVFSFFVMTYYLLIERPFLHTKLEWFTKDRATLEKAKNYLDTLEEQLGGWVRGEIVLMFVVGLLTYIALTLLSIPYALPLAILAGLLELVPNLGPTIAAIPAIIIAFSVHGPIVGIAVLLVAIAIQQLENNYLVPLIMSASAKVSSLVVILVILMGAQLAGVIGALLAVPLYITVRSWYSFYRSPKLSS